MKTETCRGNDGVTYVILGIFTSYLWLNIIKIIENENGAATKKIFNIGNPKNDVSIKQLAEMIVKLMKDYPNHCHLAQAAKIITTSAQNYYGTGYQDLGFRVPSIDAAKRDLNWEPKVDLESALRQTLDYHLASH